METTDSKERSQSERAITAIAYSMILGCSAIVLFAVQTKSFTGFYSVLGVGLLIACASLLSGGLAGFLFGIPKTLQERPEPKPTNDQNNARQADKTSVYQTNTNLEQISDWLTKILVGVGLTQLTSIPETLKKFADFAAPGLGGSQGSNIFSVVLLIFFLVCGFLISYLWTRLYLKREFANADIETKFNELENQAINDAKASSLTNQQLSSGPGTSKTSQEELNLAMTNASTFLRSNIFYQASEVRSKNWRDTQTKYLMERTIPIFRALIASDTDDKYHKNHGQLGFALKDQRNPDYQEAEKELTKAINIRGDWKEKGWLFYEFNRALCGILQLKTPSGIKTCDEEAKIKILSDLKTAAHAPELKTLISGDEVIQAWLRLNEVKLPA